MNNELWVKDITQLILSLLADERNEVRESTAETLSGLLHCEFIKIDDKLIDYFKAKSNHKLNKRKQTNGSVIIDPKDITLRHGGILGLCACINAFPYDVPQFMPDVIMFMSDHLNDPQPIPVSHSIHFTNISIVCSLIIASYSEYRQLSRKRYRISDGLIMIVGVTTNLSSLKINWLL
jgi:hypothetical protein